MSKGKFDIFFLVESGIGNAIQVLYALEYCLHNGIKAGIGLNKISRSFVEFLKESYGQDIVFDETKGIQTTNLVQSFTYYKDHEIVFDNYFYVMANKQTSEYKSETEQFLSIVKALYPSDYYSPVLTRLKEDYSDRLKQLSPADKYIIYPGCVSIRPVKRWPYFKELITKLDSENVIVIGGPDDLDYRYSYYYPKWLTGLVPKNLLYRIQFFNLALKLGVLKEHSHLRGIEKEQYSFFNYFSWGELVALLRRGRYFIGNDGGLTHLAAACGQRGFAIFGPTAINKNKPLNPAIVAIARSYSCQPCQFSPTGEVMGLRSIMCPYQMRCLYDIKAQEIFEKVNTEAPL